MERNKLGQFKKGIIPWNKNTKGLQIAWNKGIKGFRHSGSFQKGHLPYKGIEWGWFKKGNKGYWKGRKRPLFSERWRKNMSKVKRGKFIGEESPNWKGGRRRGHYTDWKYNRWRDLVFKRDDYICWICEMRGNKLQAHHLKDWFNYPELRYNIKNGLTLCIFCHKTYTKFKL